MDLFSFILEIDRWNWSPLSLEYIISWC